MFSCIDVNVNRVFFIIARSDDIFFEKPLCLICLHFKYIRVICESEAAYDLIVWFSHSEVIIRSSQLFVPVFQI